MTRIFSEHDQLAFAKLSGDYNPIHVDAVAARRSIAGRPVVHGVHGMLWALDQMLGAASLDAPIRLIALNAAFRKAINLNEPIELRIDGEGTRRKLDLTGGGKMITSIAVAWDRADAATDGGRIPDAAPPQTPCRDRAAEELKSLSGRLPLCFERAAAARLFPHVSRLLHPGQLAGLLAGTRLVGMEAPGRHSLLFELDLRAADESMGPDLVYRTAGLDERMALLTLSLDLPGFSGEIGAFLRPPPVRQPPLPDLLPFIRPGEFAGRRALVIGGSRGLGEAAVKLLAGGGADVRFTYHMGKSDAEALAAEIHSNGFEASAFAYDYRTDAPRLAEALRGWGPTVLCYFATPFISSAVSGRFAWSLFEEFGRCYVDGLHRAFLAVQSLSPGLRDVIAPSSMFVEDLQANMGEYAAAKSAGEILCRFLAKIHREVRFHTPRLPRLATDQTASLLKTDCADSAAAILSVLRKSLELPTDSRRNSTAR